MDFDARGAGKDSRGWKLLIAAALMIAAKVAAGTAQLPSAVQPPSPMALFYSIDVSPSRIVFENPKHDFPQRIGYERKVNALLAWIEGTQNGKVRRVEFPYVRTSCGPA